MSKIVLVNPPLSKKARYGKLAGAGMYMPPHGLGCLASFARREGYEVKILDCEALGLTTAQASGRIMALCPDYVGITATTVSIFSASELAGALRIFKGGNKPYIILGGIHLSALPEETMGLFPQFDFGVIGEGEETFLELLTVLEHSKDLSMVNGIIYRDNGRVRQTKARPAIKDIDTLPYPAWDLYPEMEKYYRPSAFGFKKLPAMSLTTSRGCPFSCSFCSKPKESKGAYKEHSVGYVMEMIRILHQRYGMREIIIFDDTFGINKERLKNLCQMLIKENLKLSWSCNMRINLVDREILGLMKDAGCWLIACGIESGSQQALDFLKKDITLDIIMDTAKKIKKAGIMFKGYIMVGLPTETVESLNQTLDFVLKADLDLLTVNSFTPMPGSLDYERMDQFGKFERNWRLLNQHNYVFIPDGLSKKDLEFYVSRIARKFYLRPKIIFRSLALCFDPAKLRLIFGGFIALLKFVYFKHAQE